MSNKIVARYRDGRTVKGISLDLDPGRPDCHVRTPEGKTVEVQLKNLKALFFVRSLEGDSTRDETGSRTRKTSATGAPSSSP